MRSCTVTSSTQHKMSSSSESSESDFYLSTKNGESDVYFTQDLNDIEELFDNDAEPLATEDEARNYAVEVALEQQQQQEVKRRFSSEVSLGSW